MLRAILLTIMIMFNDVANAATKQQAQRIYYNLVKANKIVNAPKLKIVPYINDHDYDNAGTGRPWRYIYLTRYKMQHLNVSGIAWVLGHELGHVMRKHIGSTHKNEFEADAIGTRLARKIGVDRCNGAAWLKNRPVSPSHPSGAARLRAMGCK